MNWIKKYWFQSAAAVLVAVIAFNLWTVYRVRSRPGGESAGARAATRKNPAKQSETAALAATGPGEPRTIAVRVAPENTDDALDGSRLAQSLEAIAGVRHAETDAENPAMLKLTIVEPMTLSLLSERLGFQAAAVVEDQSPLTGGLRLHVSGMT